MARRAARGRRRRARPSIPLGGGTRLDYGLPPTRPGIGLSLARLSRMVDYPADDLTITVEAGMTWPNWQDAWPPERQWLPIDVPQPERATVGGAVAANAGRPAALCLRHDAATTCWGFAAVDGRGRRFAGGGRVVKNAAGYNMRRLHGRLAGHAGRRSPR